MVFVDHGLVEKKDLGIGLFYLYAVCALDKGFCKLELIFATCMLNRNIFNVLHWCGFSVEPIVSHSLEVLYEVFLFYTMNVISI